MTLCDVCGKNPSIGVVSTSIPFSCAMCKECIDHGADPEWVFKGYVDLGYKPSDLYEGLTTYKNGKYLTFKEWEEEKP